MDNRCVAICDSGIGGLNLLKKLTISFPYEDFVYFSDNANLPYGDKDESELKKIAIENYNKLLSFCPKVIVFACNTLSVVSKDIFTTSNVPVIGVFPLAIKDKRGLLLCTERTARSDFVNELKFNYDIDVAPMRGLAEEIENFMLKGKSFDFQKYFNTYKRSYDYLTLGCTHYGFLSEKIKKTFPKSQIISGESVAFKKIEKILTTCNPNKNLGSIIFVGKGSSEIGDLFNHKIFDKTLNF